MNNNNNIIANIFDKCQHSFASHSKSWQKLQQLHEDNNENNFLNMIKPYLNKILFVYKKESSVERLIDFLCKYCTQECNNIDLRDEFANNLINYLISRSNAKEKAVRLRVCQIIDQILNHMDEEAEISEETFDNIMDSLLLRLRDKIPSVRSKAVGALARLQDPSDKEDPIIIEYLRLLSHDSSKDVRKSVLQHIGISRITLSHVYSRTRDIAPDVREMATKIIHEKIGIRSFTVQQRIDLLKNGLKDRNDKVKNATKFLLANSWLVEENYDVIALLKYFAVEVNQEIAELIIITLLDMDADTSETLPPPYTQESITIEKAIFWRVLCEYMVKHQRMEMLDQYLPDTTIFVQLLENTLNDITGSLTFSELLKLCMHLDYGDEVGRRNMNHFIIKILKDLTILDIVTPLSCKILHYMCDNDNEFVRMCMELLADIRDPLDSKISEEAKSDRIRMEQRMINIQKLLEDMKAEKAVRVQQEDYEVAINVKKQMITLQQELQEVENTLDTTVYQGEAAWQRILSIIMYVLKNTNNPLKYVGISDLIDNTIVPAMAMENIEVKNMGIQCLGLYGILMKNVAQQHLPFLIQVLNNEKENIIKCTTLKIVCDFLLMYDDLLLNESNSNEITNLPKMNDFITLITQYLVTDNINEDFYNLIIEGVCKLLIYDRIIDSNILSILILLYFNPETEKQVTVRQCLSVFFPTYAMSANSHIRNLQQIFLPCISIVISSPKSSSLSQVNSLQMAQYFSYLWARQSTISSNTTTTIEEDKTTTFLNIEHMYSEECSALDICFTIIALQDELTNIEIRHLIHCLTVFQYEKHHILELQVVHQLLVHIEDGLSDKTALRYLKKCLNYIATCCKNELELPQWAQEHLTIIQEQRVKEIIEDTDRSLGQPQHKRTLRKNTKKKSTIKKTKTTKNKGGKKKLQKKKTRRIVSESEDDEEYIENNDDENIVRRHAPSRVCKTKQATKKNIMNDISNLLDDDEDNESDEEVTSSDYDEDDEPKRKQRNSTKSSSSDVFDFSTHKKKTLIQVQNEIEELLSD